MASSRTVLCTGLLFLLAGFPSASGQGFSSNVFPPPPADEILRRYLARQENHGDRQDILSHYTYQLLSVKEKLDGDGEVKDRTELLYEVYPVEGESFARLIERAGQPLTEKEAEEQRRLQEEFRRKVLEARERTAEENRKDDREEDEVVIGQDLFDRYRWEVLGRESLNGRPAYVLSFEPKDEKLPVRRRIDRALNKAAGTVWVDAADSEIARLRVRLLEKVKIWGGFLGSISEFEFELQRERASAGDWVPVREEAYLKARAFLKTIHQRTERRWQGYRKTMVSQEAGGPRSNR